MATARKPRLLVVGYNPACDTSFGVSLRELYRTRMLQERFEVAQLATGPRGRWDGAEDVNVQQAPLGDESGARGLASMLAEFRPDAVLLHGEITHFAPLAARLGRYRGAVAGWFPVNFEREANPYTWPPTLGRCDRVACVSSFGARQIARDTRQPVPVIPHGLSLARYSPVSASARRALRRRLGWRQDAFVFLSVGRNYARKGHEYSLEALRLLRAKSPALARRVYLYILTEVDEALAEFVHASGLTDNVWITDGYDAVKRPLSPRKLAELYQAADAFLLMSLSEGFGMPLLEAQAFGLPIVASNNSAIPEVVGDAGLLVRAPLRAAALDGHCLVWARPPDARHAAELMERVVRDAALRRRLAAAGRAHAAEYPWDMVGAKMVGLVEAALRDRASAKESSS